MPAVADVFGPYRLLSRIGRGGMGVTWKARRLDAPSGPVVVVKRILPGLHTDPELIEAFVNEAHVTAALSHPAIAQVLDFGRVGNEFYFAVEYVHGRTIEALLEASARKGLTILPLPVACLIAREMLSALHYAHTRYGPDRTPLKIVHRDISPDNVLLSFDGEVKVVDFGVAKARLGGREDTAVGLVKGKWTYFSPEQAVGERLDARSDLFAVGVMLYRMLCGQRPFAGDQAAAMRNLLTGEHPPPQALNPSLPEVLAKAIERSLETNREKRFQTAQHMGTALDTVLQEHAAGVGRDALCAFIRWAFEGDLEAERVERNSKAQSALVAAWVSQTPRAGGQAASTGSAPRRDFTHAVTAPPVARPLRRRWPLVLGALFLAGAALAVGLVLAKRASPPEVASFERRSALGRLETRQARLLELNPPAAAAYDTRIAVLRGQLEQVTRHPDQEFLATCAETERSLERAIADATPKAGPETPTPAAAPPETRPYDRVSLDGAPPWKVTLNIPKHNLLAIAFEPKPTTVATLPRNTAIEYWDHSGLLAVARVGDGPEVLVADHDGDPFRKPRPRGFSSLRFLDFQPFDAASEKGEYGVAPESWFQRSLDAQRVTPDIGHYVLIGGLDRSPGMEFKLASKLAADELILVNCGKGTTRKSESFTLWSQRECGLALLAPARSERELTLLLTPMLGALPDPPLPPFRDRAQWNPFPPSAMTKGLGADNLKQAENLFAGVLRACENASWGPASQALGPLAARAPGSAEVQLLAGFVASRQGDKAKALEHYRQFLALSPRHKSASAVRKMVSDSEKDVRPRPRRR